MRVTEHIVRGVDTIQSIATRYLYSADRWRDIVDFNNLDYPYLTDDPNFQTGIYASGLLTAVRNYTASALTIPAGTAFIVPVVEGVPSRIYKSLSIVTIPAGTVSTSIPVQCTIAGIWGNVPSDTITQIQTSDPVLQGAFKSITNPAAFSNGAILNVKILGDSILVPVDDSWNGDDTYENLDDFYNRSFGEDLELGDDGDMVFDGYGSIGSVRGASNLAQAIRDRLTTPKLSLVYHPEYGSVLGQIVANGSTPYTIKWLSLAIIETLLADDRVASVTVISVTLSDSVMNIVVDVTPINRGQSVRVPAILYGLPIAA